MTDPVTNYCHAILGDNPTAKEAIRYIPEFGECSDELLDYIFRYSKPVDLPHGETLIKQGEFDQWVYFIIKGDLEVVINDKKLGISKGPVVGERCILGEPRGANLLSGANGVMALGVEMSIVDEIHREINNFRNSTEDETQVQDFIENRMKIVLELLSIVLKDVTRRISEIYQSSLTGADHLEKVKSDVKVEARSLYDFSSKSGAASQLEHTNQEIKRFTLFSFHDFAEIVYYEILQKHMSEFGFLEFPVESWAEKFIHDPVGGVQLEATFEWMRSTYHLTSEKLVDVATSVFEIASQYTNAGNRSVNSVLSEFDTEDDRQKAVSSSSGNDNSEREQMSVFIQQDLFTPIKDALNSKSGDSDNSPSKMSQADIDALFG